MRQRFTGHNELSGMLNSLLWFAASTLAMVVALVEGGVNWAVVWFVSASLTPVIWFGARYRLDVSEAGVALRRYWLWPFGWTERYHLDCSADLYDAWESDRAEGVFLDTGSLLDDSDVFGPYFDTAEMAALAGRVNDAVSDARRRASRLRALTTAELDPRDFDVLERSPGGPPRTVRAVRRARFRGFEIPAGSTCRLNRDGWVDPGRQDFVAEIELAASTTLPNGVVVPAGASISLSAHAPERVVVRGMRELQVDDVHVRCADQSMAFDDGELVDFVLASPIVRNGVFICAGSQVRRTRLIDEDCWSVTLGGPARVANIDLGRDDYVTFDDQWRPQWVTVRQGEVMVDGVQLRGDLCALPIRHGRLDLRECRARGLAEKSASSRARDLASNLVEGAWFYAKLTIATVAAVAALVLLLELLL